MNLKGITMKNILITGVAGLVGTVLTQGLQDKYNVKILDILKILKIGVVKIQLPAAGKLLKKIKYY